MSSPLPGRLDWFSAVGNFILNYGVLDWHVLIFLESRLSPDQFSKIKNEHFQARIARVKDLVNAGDCSARQKQDFARFFQRLDPVCELRNHIAHGHLLVRVTKDGKTPVLTLSLPKNLDSNYAPDTRHLEFSVLTSALTELAALIEEFQKLSGGWRNETSMGDNP